MPEKVPRTRRSDLEALLFFLLAAVLSRRELDEMVGEKSLISLNKVMVHRVPRGGPTSMQGYSVEYPNIFQNVQILI
jgi:hypothetical protein